MKVVLLVAGEGSRLRPFSNHKKPKIMLPFLGKPVLGWQVEEFIRANLSRFVIVANPKNIESIKRYLLDSYPEARFQFAVQKKQLGPAHAIYQAKEFLKSEDFFIFKYTDNVTEKDQVEDVLKVFKPDLMQAVVTLKKVKYPSHYGIAKFNDNGLVTAIIEKPEPGAETSDLANTGIGVINSELFFKGIEADDLTQNKKEVPPQEYVLRQGGKAGFWVYKKTSIDLGRPWNILEVNHLLIDRYLGRRQNFVSLNSTVGEKTELNGYVSLQNASVGRNCYLKNTYVLEGTRIGNDCYIEDTVIGRNTVIGDGFKVKPKPGKAVVRVLVKDAYMETGYKKLGCFIGDNVKVAKGLSCAPGKVVYSDRKVREDIVKNLVN